MINSTRIRNLTEGLVDFANLVNLDGLGLGEQELALGKENWDRLKKQAKFPLVLSNLVDAEGKPFFTPSLILNRGGLKIGVLALISPGLFPGSVTATFPGLRLKDPIATAQDLVRELKPQVDLIVLLSHLGMEADEKIPAQVEGINLIIGSHPGIQLFSPIEIKDTLIVQTGEQGKYIGRLDFKVTGTSPRKPFPWTKNVPYPPALDNHGGILWYRNFLEAASEEIPEDARVQQLIKRIKASISNLN
jgi:2',3'-cyclic-nucleotide 2'-phosphodiesterase (5'-nucleotidase family)